MIKLNCAITYLSFRTSPTILIVTSASAAIRALVSIAFQNKNADYIKATSSGKWNTIQGYVLYEQWASNASKILYEK